jgi:NTP pyrophosphatase (non-canonical NTP hydrolase)
MKDLQEFMDKIHKWADSAFGEDRKPIATAHHLNKEAKELKEALEKENHEEIIEELCDCFILILNTASKYGLKAIDLMVNSEHKLEICKKRKWGKPDEFGARQHIK